MRESFPKEVAIIGATTVLVGMPMLYLVGRKKPLTVMQMALVMFATGATMHMLYEFTGGNKYFCEQYLKQSK